MKRILIFLMAIVTLAVTSPAFAAKQSIMELPLFLFSSCVTQIASYPLRDQPI